MTPSFNLCGIQLEGAWENLAQSPRPASVTPGLIHVDVPAVVTRGQTFFYPAVITVQACASAILPTPAQETLCYKEGHSGNSRLTRTSYSEYRSRTGFAAAADLTPNPNSKESIMRPSILLISLIAAALGTTGALAAKGHGPGGFQGGGTGYGAQQSEAAGQRNQMSSQGGSNSNAQFQEDATRGKARAEERRSLQSQEQLMEQERLRLKDGSGPMHEQRSTGGQQGSQTRNEVQVRQQTQSQLKAKGQAGTPLQLEEQIRERSLERQRVNQ